VKLSALESVGERAQAGLAGHLGQTAPRIQELRAPRLPARMADDSRLWFVFARLNEALEALEVQKLRAMPPHEREVLFRSARLRRRIMDAAAQDILTQYNLPLVPRRIVYELRVGSQEVRAHEGDFNFALAPAADQGFLDRQLNRTAGGIVLPLPIIRSGWERMATSLSHGWRRRSTPLATRRWRSRMQVSPRPLGGLASLGRGQVSRSPTCSVMRLGFMLLQLHACSGPFAPCWRAMATTSTQVSGARGRRR
jgi:hypothetical protein